MSLEYRYAFCFRVTWKRSSRLPRPAFSEISKLHDLPSENSRQSHRPGLTPMRWLLPMLLVLPALAQEVAPKKDAEAPKPAAEAPKPAVAVESPVPATEALFTGSLDVGYRW